MFHLRYWASAAEDGWKDPTRRKGIGNQAGRLFRSAILRRGWEKCQAILGTRQAAEAPTLGGNR